MLMIKRDPRVNNKSAVKIYKDGVYVAAVKVVDNGMDGVTLGCIADQDVTFLRSEVPYRESPKE